MGSLQLRFPLLVPVTVALLAVSADAEPAQQGAADVGVAGGGDLQAVLESIRDEHALPALATVMVHKDEVVEMAATGLRAVGFDDSVTSGDLWHLGSLTKAMTATLAAVLVERGEIAWGTTVGELFPDLVGNMDSQYVDATLEDLLYHRAGLPVDVTRSPSWPFLRWDTTAIIVQRRRFAAELLAMSPEGPRGRFLYTNAGYIVAGAMLEQVTGVSWEDLMAREIFVPLGMRSCGFGPPGTPGSRDQPWGHVGTAGSWKAVEPGPLADNPRVLGPAGTVHCALDDYARFMIEHLAGARGVAGLITAESFDKLQMPAAGSSYAMGWSVAEREWAGGRVLVHNGSNTMWWANVWLAPERDLGLFAVTNAGGDDAFRGTDAAVVALLVRLQAAARH